MTQEELEKLKESRKKRFEQLWSKIKETPLIDYDFIDYVNPIGKGKKDD